MISRWRSTNRTLLENGTIGLDELCERNGVIYRIETIIGIDGNAVSERRSDSDGNLLFEQNWNYIRDSLGDPKSLEYTPKDGQGSTIEYWTRDFPTT